MDHTKTMERVATLARWVLGSIFLIAGINGLFGFLPLPDATPAGREFFDTLENTGYFVYMLRGVEILAGLFILSNIFAPTMLVLITPVVANIALYGIFLDPKTLPLAATVVGLTGFLFYYYKRVFSIFLKYQIFSNPAREETANIIIYEELKEKNPKQAKKLEGIMGGNTGK